MKKFFLAAFIFLAGLCNAQNYYNPNTVKIFPVQPIYSGKQNTMLFSNVPNAGSGYTGKIWCIPLSTQQQHYVTDISINVTAAFAASNVKVALYTDSVGLLGHLVEASGDISSATTGLKSYTFASAINLTTQQYWGCFQQSSGSVTIGQAPTATNTTYIGGTTLTSAAGGFTQAYGTFPSHFTFDTNNGSFPLICLKAQ